MKNFLKWLIPIIIIGTGIVLITLVLIPKAPVEDEIPLEMYGPPESIVTYATSGGAIYDGAVFLDRIIVELDETSASVTLKDATGDAASSTIFFNIEGNSLQGVYEIGARLNTGIWSTVSGSTGASFIFIPMGK